MAAVYRLVGLLGRPEYHQAESVLQYLEKEKKGRIETCQPLMEFQWTHWLSEMKKEREVWSYTDSVAVFINDTLMLGGLSELLHWAAESFHYQDCHSIDYYQKIATQAYDQHIASSEIDFVFMDVCVEGDLIGRLVLELDSFRCPQTSQNFLKLCAGYDDGSGKKMSYVNSLIHRIVPGGWIQSGDICGGTGMGGTSIYGKVFEDESFAIPHSSAGIVGMVNHGCHTNNSQFYITLAPASWMDRQYVAFGRVVEGSGVLQALSRLDLANGRPIERCQISNCGCLS